MRLEREFVELELRERRLTIREGMTGTAGAERVETFWFGARASSAYRRLITQKQAEGYREGKQLVIPAGLREPELEAAIRADRDDPAGYDVYADWLQQHGELSVDDSFLTIAGVRAVKDAFPTVYSRSQREAENGNVRFVSVWE